MRFKSIWLGPCYMHPLGRSHYEWHSPVGLVKFRGFAGEYEMEFQGVKRKLGSDTFDCARREAEEFVADECRRTLEQLGVELFADPAARPLDVLSGPGAATAGTIHAMTSDYPTKGTRG